MSSHPDVRLDRRRPTRFAVTLAIAAVAALFAPIAASDAAPAAAAVSAVTVTEAPQNYQVTPRGSDNTAIVPVAGTINDSSVTEVRLVVTGNGTTQNFSSSSASFRFTPSITAGLFEYTFQLTAIGPGLNAIVDTREHVVAGDVFVIQGQSNALSSPRGESAAGEHSPFIRSYAGTNWHYASGTGSPAFVGQWGIRMAKTIVDTQQIPVALFNGAEGGKSVDFFQRNDANPNASNTNYGRLRTLLTAAGVLSGIKAVLWYQGESDLNDAAAHVSGFTSLLQDWRSEFGTAFSGGSKYYMVQVRNQGCLSPELINLREAQRKLADTEGLTLLSPTAIDAHFDCHYFYLNGSRDLGDQAFANLNRDFYGGPSAGISPPNPSTVTASGSQLTVQLRNTTDALTVEQGAAADFKVVGSNVAISSVASEAGGKLVLSLSGPATGITSLIYHGHNGAGPAITNATGVGLLAFQMGIEGVPAPAGLAAGDVVTLKNSVSGQTAHVYGQSLTNGAAIAQWTPVPAGTLHAQFRLGATATPGVFTLVAVHSNKCMNVAGGVSAQGAKVVQWSCVGVAHEQFRLRLVSADLYEIVAPYSNLCVRIPGSSTTPGDQLEVGNCWAYPETLWKVDKI